MYISSVGLEWHPREPKTQTRVPIMTENIPFTIRNEPWCPVRVKEASGSSHHRPIPETWKRFSTHYPAQSLVLRPVLWLAAVYSDWVRMHIWPATFVSVWQHVRLCEQTSLRYCLPVAGTESSQRNKTTTGLQASQRPVSWRPATVKWRQFSQSNRHSTVGTRQIEYREALPSSVNVQSYLTSSLADDDNASW